MALYMCFTETLVKAITVSEILAQIYHQGQNLTFMTFKMTFRVIPHYSYFKTGLVSQQRSYMNICRVVYMSLWSSGRRELERREVWVLPPRGRVGGSVSLVWAFGESTR